MKKLASFIVGVITLQQVFACCMLPRNYKGTIRQNTQEAVIFHDDGMQDMILRMERGWRCDGIVGRITPEIHAAAQTAGIPVVNTWANSPVAAELPAVFADQERAGRMAIEHLYARGLRRFVIFCDRGRVAETKQAQGAVQAAADLDCGHTCHVSDILIENSRAAWQHFSQTLKTQAQNWQAPLGIMAGRDLRGRQLIEEIQILGWSVPLDVAVVSIGNDRVYCERYPSLSSVDLGYQVVGYEAARMLASLLRGETAPTSPLITPPKALVLRQSSDFFAVANEQVGRALRFMFEHSHSSLTVHHIAAHVGVSHQTLNLHFQRHVGHSVLKELTRMRVEHLKRLLVEFDEPLREIGRRAGIRTESQLYRIFKAATGMTPKAYRQTHSLGRV